YHIWNIAEHQPDFLEGGRANTVAIHPTNQNELFVASDSGGLFKSIDRGLSWKHIDGLPVIFLQSVAYVDSNIILVSAAPDFKTPNSGGGVWRSADGGDTWTQAELMVGATRPTLTAFEISTSENNAVVGTSIGLFASTDGGLSWKYQDSFGHQTAVFAVLVTPGVTPGDPSRIYAGGPAGVRLGTIPLGSWVPPVNNNLGGIHPIHAFGRSPLISSQAFLANGHLLFYTDDTGITWKEIPTKNQPSCGGGP